MKEFGVFPLEQEDAVKAAEIEKQTEEAWSRAAILEELQAPSSRCYVLCKDREVIGLSLWQLAAEEASLLKISIHKDFRRQGMGRFLMESTLQMLKADGAERFFLEVRKSNLPAVLLYESCGFQKAGIRRDFYAHPTEDAFVMNRED